MGALFTIYFAFVLLTIFFADRVCLHSADAHFESPSFKWRNLATNGTTSVTEEKENEISIHD